MATSNPFTPGFGAHPPNFTGRDQIIETLIRALEEGPPTRMEYTTLLLGPRGTGKTTVLSSIMDEATACGWRVIHVDTPFAPPEHAGALAEISEAAYEHMEELDSPPRRQFAGFSIPLLGGGVRWDNKARRPPTPKKLLSDLVKATEASGGAGVLVAMDEFHNMTPSEASQIAGALQQIAKVGKRRMAFVGAALPHIEHTLLREEGFTFFQRGYRSRIGNLSLPDARDAIGVPLANGGVVISDDRLQSVAEATRGLAYAVQSAGYHLWEAVGTPPALVTDADVGVAIAAMHSDVDRHVASPIWSRLSKVDRLFLAAMTADDGPSTLLGIAKRLGSAMSNPSTYKDRLLRAGAIIEKGQELHFASGAVRDRASEERDMAAFQSEAFRMQEGDMASAPNVEPAPIPQREICGAWMPRAKAYCRLPEGHRGNHRNST